MSDIEFIEDGDLFFERLWDMIDGSKTCCWLLTYHMADNFTANETMKRLTRAAQRGVNVVLFVDWLNYWLNGELAQELRHKGGVVVALNPMSFITRFFAGQQLLTKEIFERYHQKLCIIDDQLIIGTANLDCEYAGAKHGTSNFHDLNVLLKGTLISDAQSIFQNIAARYHIPLRVPRIPETLQPHLELLMAEPKYMRFEIQEKVLDMITTAKERITLVHGYYFYIPKVVRAIRDAVDRGVKVELFTSRSRDQPCYTHLRNSWLTKEIREAGAHVYEYPQRILHMKAYVVDNEFLVGSFNNDKWSWGLNNELSLYNTDPALTARLMERIDSIKKRSSEVHDEKLTFKQSVMTLLSWLFLETSERVMDRRKWMKENFEEAFIDVPGETTESRYLRKRKARRFHFKESKCFINLGLFL